MSKWRSLFVVNLFLILLYFNNMIAQEPTLPLTDDELKSMIAAANPTEKDANAEAIIVLDYTNIVVENSGLGHTNIRYVEKILQEKRATNYSRLRFDYDPMSNMVEVQQVRVIRKNGTIESVDTNQLLDLPQPQDWIIWGPRMKIVRLPRLYPGDALEYKIYKKGFMIAYLAATDDESRYIPPMRGHFYDIVFFENNLPIKLKYYQVSTHRDVPIQYEVYHGEIGSYVTFTKTENIYKFWKMDVSAFSKEELAIAESDLITKVVLATVPDWQTKSRWFYRANDFPWEINPGIKESVFSWDDAIKKTVNEIISGMNTDEEKIAAIVHWAAQEIRYSGITMG
ncbi:DUF3857 domain-containing protein, partial [candidate division KSB1 bacterium]|nr:DUF3857 domain-containing protein [candidate division KSB1 bacterium]